jgi:hypothetical protein
MLAALNDIIRTRQDAYWELGYGGTRATIVVRTLALGGGSVVAPVALPNERR